MGRRRQAEEVTGTNRNISLCVFPATLPTSNLPLPAFLVSLFSPNCLSFSFRDQSLSAKATLGPASLSGRDLTLSPSSKLRGIGPASPRGLTFAVLTPGSPGAYVLSPHKLHFPANPCLLQHCLSDSHRPPALRDHSGLLSFQPLPPSLSAPLPWYTPPNSRAQGRVGGPRRGNPGPLQGPDYFQRLVLIF